MKLPITREELLSKYTERINSIADDIDTKTHFTGEEVCQIIYSIMVKHGAKIKIKPATLYGKYMNSVYHISDEEWGPITVLRKSVILCMEF
jgi:hypothetical protein